MKKTWKILKELLAILLAAALFWGATTQISKLLMPVRKDYGSTWEQFGQEPENSCDVLIAGSSIVYCDLIPACIYKESGVAAYLIAGPEQTIPLSYYAIREACRTQRPKAVVLELNGMFFAQYQNYTRVNVGYMPWSANRLGATLYAAEAEERLNLMVPIFAYHSQWIDVSPQQAAKHLHPQADPWAGYTLLTKAKPQSETYEGNFSTSKPSYKTALKYLKKISEFCDENDIRLLLYLAPSMRKVPAQTLAEMEADVGALHAEYRDFNRELDGLGIDDDADWYDSVHLNFAGAEKFSKVFAEFLLASGATPGGNADSALWESRVETYLKQKQASAS